MEIHMTSTLKDKFLHLSLGSILAHILLINGRVRPVALVMVRNEHLEKCIDLIKNEGMNIILNPRGNNHTAVYIYKNSSLGHIINFALGKPYDKKTLMHWINGKMFGYSDESIEDFIMQKLE